MGLIQDTIKRLRKDKRRDKTVTSQEIEQYIQSEKYKDNLERIKRYERDSFLYG